MEAVVNLKKESFLLVAEAKVPRINRSDVICQVSVSSKLLRLFLHV